MPRNHCSVQGQGLIPPPRQALEVSAAHKLNRLLVNRTLNQARVCSAAQQRGQARVSLDNNKTSSPLKQALGQDVRDSPFLISEFVG